MARKVPITKTPQQRREEMQALQESIAGKVEALRDSDQWKQYLAFAGKFHTYSVNNVLLIMAQRPTATRVAGYEKWRELGRQVRKGERSIRIYGGRSMPVSAEDHTTGTEDPERTKFRVFPVAVFDISQTEKIDPNSLDPAEGPARQLSGADHHGLYDATTAYLRSRGWSVDREPIPGPVNGFSTTDGTHRVVIDANLSDAHAAKTALHEAAHVLLDHTADVKQYHQHRGLMETEAESVAYIAAGIAGVDTSQYSIGYIAGWAHGDAAVLKETASKVLRAAHTLIEGISELDRATEDPSATQPEMGIAMTAPTATATAPTTLNEQPTVPGAPPNNFLHSGIDPTSVPDNPGGIKVTVLSGPGCVQCTSTYSALARRGVRHLGVDLDQDPQAKDAVMALGYRQVPVIVIQDAQGKITDHWAGFRPDKLSDLTARIKAAGTPPPAPHPVEDPDLIAALRNPRATDPARPPLIPIDELTTKGPSKAYTIAASNGPRPTVIAQTRHVEM